MDMSIAIARIKRAGGATRVVPVSGDVPGMYTLEAKFVDGWQPIIENVSKVTAEAIIKQATETRQLLID